eukprot:TRINITY_DN14160_c0_g1_i1.p2 TRINITY_DN14160_c0_g1~~TRINITY_DN14160_c0_g1_i1.p2  ORF type:complete len:180 (+),score=21.26 TRINITY_DN14160_c0_g1_i1:53-592(+)
MADDRIFVKEYQIVGRHKVTEKVANPKVYRMRIFAGNTVVAKSRFWYFLKKLHKIKRVNGEILNVSEIYEAKPSTVKNFGIYLRYNSRTGIHNMHKEYRATTRVGAVSRMYQEMASRHQARFNNIQIIEVNELKASQCRRPHMQTFHDSKIKFPLPHRVQRVPLKKRRTFEARRPVTVW